ncbi:MAG: hypothetical protein Hyperionvirus10_26 [Hyperionvirus sp.]|uniref:Uncharacterized protein n=1 Tax=Hyperionvirus sp. TaxID=2487770 RepID=A0A3G5A8U6_9VIRU|nr:MAG: hypothetical protein Hyperionvirus10_26 [Hyperionvirus sp.]
MTYIVPLEFLIRRNICQCGLYIYMYMYMYMYTYTPDDIICFSLYNGTHIVQFELPT